MEDFPKFMKNKENRISSKEQNTDDIEFILNPGDEIFIPKGTVQWGKCIAGARLSMRLAVNVLKNHYDNGGSIVYNVGILIFNNVELLDFAGPYEAFSVTSELNNYELFNVFTITQNGKEIKSVNGLKVLPDFSFDDHPDIDILIIPGGDGTKTEMLKEDVLDWINRNYENSKITMSVCSGARLLGKLGLLDGMECTTHHEVLEHLQEIAPKAVIKSDKRFTGNGRVFTSAGISAGIDLSLHIIEKLYGRDVANKTIVYMEYKDWEKLY